MLEGAPAASQNPVQMNALRDGCGRYERRALTNWQPCALWRSRAGARVMFEGTPAIPQNPVRLNKLRDGCKSV